MIHRYYQQMFDKGDKVTLTRDIMVSDHERRHGGQTTHTFLAGSGAVIHEEPHARLSRIQLYCITMDGIPTVALHNVPEFCLIKAKD